MEKTFVEHHDGGYWIKGKRISLDSVIYAFKFGAAPESIQRSYPGLTLEEVYGAITFYLGNEDKVDAYLEESAKEFDELARQTHEKLAAENPDLYRRMTSAQKSLRR
jgi:uncharacterized protein (DUF433 family)